MPAKLLTGDINTIFSPNAVNDLLCLENGVRHIFSTSWLRTISVLWGMVAVLTMAVAGPVRADAEPASTPDAGCAGCLILTSMLIQGVSAYPLADLADTYDQQLARRVSVDDLVQSANAITARYRNDGYFLTRAVVAETDPAIGAARIVVFEGYISELKLTGDGARAVEPILKPLVNQRPLTIGELDRRLSLASDVPGVKLTSRIEPIIGDPAQHRLVVETAMTSGSAGVYVDNRGSETQGPWQVYLSGARNSTFMAGDQITLGVLTVPDRPDELTYIDASYSVVASGGGRVRFGVSGYETDAPLQNASGWVGGSSRMASVTLSHPLVRSRDKNFWLNAGLDVRRVEQNYVATGRTDETLTVARMSVAGQRRSSSGWMAGSIQLSKGIDAFGATTERSPLNTRYDATGEFFKVNAQVSAYRDLSKYVGVYVEASGQWSDDALLSSEEFFVGGPTYGRAYDYGEASGDKAVAGMIEARVGYDPKGDLITFAQAFAFFDTAKVWNKTPGRDWSEQLTSAGVGSRITFDRKATLRIEFAKPLSRAPYNQPDKGWRTFVSLSKQF